jgi:HEAT repeat protein
VCTGLVPLIWSEKPLARGVVMGVVSLHDIVTKRRYSDLEQVAKEHIERGEWESILSRIAQCSPSGKSRDAVVSLLELESVGGTDSNLFSEFTSLEGNTLQEIRIAATERAIGLLREQVAERHTYFIDVEEMSTTPFAVLAKEVIEARKRELEELQQGASRIEVLGTYYGYTILLTDGAKPHEGGTGYRYWRRRTWLDEKINESAAAAIKKITGEFAEAVDMDLTYRTIGHDPVFKKRCTPETARILADAVRVSLYKVPGNRAKAARDLGRTGDSRAVAFLHNRFPTEQNRGVRTAIAEALGQIGHESSVGLLQEYVESSSRRQTKDVFAAVDALGRIDADQARAALVSLLESGSNAVKAKSIESLSRLDIPDMIQLVTPYATHKSRPVVRAAVDALLRNGDQGTEVVKENVPTILGRIGSDRTSRFVLTKVLSISGIGERQETQDYFAKRIKNAMRQLERWQASRNRGYSYGYWWQRRERRARTEMEEVVRMAAQCTRPPFSEGLLASLCQVRSKLTDGTAVLAALGQGDLANAVRRKSQ